MSNAKTIQTPMEQDLQNEETLTSAKLQKYKVMFIRINRGYRENLTSKELYDITRWCWRVDVEKANKCDYVFAVYQRHIVAVYASPIWEKITKDNYKQAPDHCEKPELFIDKRSFFTCVDYAKFDNSPLINKKLADEFFPAHSSNPTTYNYEMN